MHFSLRLKRIFADTLRCHLCKLIIMSNLDIPEKFLIAFIDILFFINLELM